MVRAASAKGIHQHSAGATRKVQLQRLTGMLVIVDEGYVLETCTGETEGLTTCASA